MYDGVLEINDACMRLSTATGTRSVPAVTLLENNTLTLGNGAYKQSRLKPLQINNRFVQQLNTLERDELAPHARHHADLAHKLLLQLLTEAADPARLVFAVPSHYNDEQLSLLLGIAAASPAQAVGLVDIAVAAVSGLQLSGNAVYCQMQSHQTVLTELQADDGQLLRREVVSVDGAGKEDLLDTLLHITADAFVEQCRFDPLREARVEQQLVTQIEAAIFGANEARVEYIFELEEKHRARLSPAKMLAALQDLEVKLASRARALSANSHIVFCPMLSELPLHAAEQQAVLRTPYDLLASNVSAQSDAICSNAEHLPFVFSLPLLQPLSDTAPPTIPTVAQVTPANTGDLPASHFLLNDEAVAIGNAVYFSEMGRAAIWSEVESSTSSAVLSRQGEQISLRALSGASVLLNGHAVTAEQTIAKGDVMQLSEQGSRIRFIRVL